ncbi:MAG: TIGR01548 family HAD-type hydrolase [Chloroflexota bacterium]
MTTLVLDAVLFDMDGTLIDDRLSYREATRLTAQSVLGRPVRDEHIAEVKRRPGFNNDWDTTWALVEWMRGGAIALPGDADRRSPDYERLRSLFQTYYLGARTWREWSGEEPPLPWADPLILRETLLVSFETLERLDPFAVGIATSRPRAEALMAVRQHGLDRFFDASRVVGLQDASHEKPHPAPLLELAARLGCTHPAYVGDTINDAIAAHHAGMPFVHVGTEPLTDPDIERTIAHRIPTVNDVVDLVRAVSTHSSTVTAHG